MNAKEIRWKQRFQNFEKAFFQFDEAVSSIDKLSVLEKEGLIQRFEYTFELAWKTLKDYLESQEVEAKFPREVIKKGFQYEIISDGEMWMEMLEKRNLIAHNYDKEIFEKAVSQVVDLFHPEVKKLFIYFKNQA
jgi:nucleotidyltransferase substrate binding protein (TIGR01987 family)